MSEVVILVPVLGRPHRVAPLLASIEESTTVAHRVLFLCDPGDRAEVSAVQAEGAEHHFHPGGYAAKINHGVRVTAESLVFLGADDLCFHPGWFEAATARLTDSVHVVGVNDQLRRRRVHTTHFLVTRHYCELGTIDGQDGLLFEGYHHWRIDDEFVATAKMRDAYDYAPNAVVEHLHHLNGKAPDDKTYRRGRARINQDNDLFTKRESLWT